MTITNEDAVARLRSACGIAALSTMFNPDAKVHVKARDLRAVLDDLKRLRERAVCDHCDGAGSVPMPCGVCYGSGLRNPDAEIATDEAIAQGEDEGE